ncbi:cytochrome P450 [Mycobacterium paraseoulense]|nr:cytochrome P450 [Mycobacterium paraseoulense]MCV7395427.1 cytochrome P450 [Mycobacterium paraseoulense]BBZ71818.1 cytochrome P450 [Mycobacterium paraseoulense]
MSETTALSASHDEESDDVVTEGIAAEAFGGDFAAMLTVPEPQEVYAGIGSAPIIVIDGNHIVGAAKSVDALTRSHDVRGSGALGNTQSADRPLIPLDIDRPEHTKYRKLLDPIFSAKAIAHLETDVRTLADELIDKFIERGHADIYDEFCAILPSTIFLRLMGIPLSELNYFLQNKDDLLRDIDGETVAQREARYKAAGKRCYAYFNQVLDEREASGEPGDDILGRFMTAEVDGHSLTRENILDICFLLMIAGLDTVAASLSCILSWLARHPDERRQVVANPEMWPDAIEELMRWETPVPVASRTPTVDMQVGQTTVAAGTQVTVLWAAANLDPEKFKDPLKVNLTRRPNPHYSFASGFHRCLGSHLARMELRAALDQFHKRIPDYEITPGSSLKYEALPVRLARPLPLSWEVRG